MPIVASSFDAKVKSTAWSQKRSYAVVSTQDRMISPDLERFMSSRAKSGTIELVGSHAIFLSHPKEIAALIEKAAKAAEYASEPIRLNTLVKRAARADPGRDEAPGNAHGVVS